VLLYICIAIALFGIIFMSCYKKETVDGNVIINQRLFYANNKIVKQMSFVMMAFLCFLTAFRSENVGNDTVTYVHFFDVIAEEGIVDWLDFEIGYQYLCLIFSKIANDAHLFLIFCAVFCYSVIGSQIKKRSENIGFSVCLFFSTLFSEYTSMLRQGIAMVIVLLAYFAIKEKRNFKAVILILLASLFHTSALLALLLFFHKYIPRKPQTMLPIIIVFVMLSISGLLTDVLKWLVPFYEGYFDESRVADGWLAMTYYLFRSIVFYFFAYFAYKDDIDNKSLEMSAFSLLMVVSSLGFAVNIFSRVIDYFILLLVIELPNAICYSKIKNKTIWMVLICLVCIAYFFVATVLRPDWNHIFPYEFWKN
jgi:hypothetical protein